MDNKWKLLLCANVVVTTAMALLLSMIMKQQQRSIEVAFVKIESQSTQIIALTKRLYELKRIVEQASSKHTLNDSEIDVDLAGSKRFIDHLEEVLGGNTPKVNGVKITNSATANHATEWVEACFGESNGKGIIGLFVDIYTKCPGNLTNMMIEID